MNALGDALVANVAVAAAVACLAWALVRTRKYPALAHVLWLVVLVRLVAPPLLTIPVVPASDADRKPSPTVSVAVAPIVVTERSDTESVEVADPGEIPPLSNLPDRDPTRFLIGLWIAGAVLVMATAARRIVRFRALLRSARPASASLVDDVRTLARRLGIRRVPAVLMLDADLPPLVWGFLCRARIVLPARLLQELDAEEVQGLLAHELAHVRRRDHWARYLELVATVLWWWLPLAWWAKKRLREAEEACCDAWAVWCAPHAREAYASALLRTITWLSASRTRVPAPAVGMSAVLGVKRRLGMILENQKRPPAIKRRVLLTCAVLPLIALLPARAQETTPERKHPSDPTPRVYEVRDICGGSEDACKQLAKLVMRNVSVKTWMRPGCNVFPQARQLIVRAPKGVHRQIEQFLDDLRTFTAKRRSDNQGPSRSRALQDQIDEVKALQAELRRQLAQLNDRRVDNPRKRDPEMLAEEPRRGGCVLRFVVVDQEGRPLKGVTVRSVTYETHEIDATSGRIRSKTQTRDPRAKWPKSNAEGRLVLRGIPTGKQCTISFARGSKLLSQLRVETPDERAVVEFRVVASTERAGNDQVRGPDPKLKGQVVAVKDLGAGVRINLGLEHGAKRAFLLDVIRGNRYLGRIRIDKVLSEHSLCTTTLIADGQTIQVGDVVTNRLN